MAHDTMAWAHSADDEAARLAGDAHREAGMLRQQQASQISASLAALAAARGAMLAAEAAAHAAIADGARGPIARRRIAAAQGTQRHAAMSLRAAMRAYGLATLGAGGDDEVAAATDDAAYAAMSAAGGAQEAAGGRDGVAR